MTFFSSLYAAALGQSKSEDSTDNQSKTTNRQRLRLDDTPDILYQMQFAKTQDERLRAAKSLYDLCDITHKKNRVPLVCGGKYDVLTPLSKCLTTRQDGPEKDVGNRLRHVACLTLNNLSIPVENKREMALGPVANEIIAGLTAVIANEEDEAHLCCICFMNISFLEDSLVPILQYSPKYLGKETTPLDNPDSLLRVLERLLKKAQEVSCSQQGKQLMRHSETVRWACGFVKNLAKSHDNCILFSKTDIPFCVVDNVLEASATPPLQWTANSVQELSLSVILNLAHWPETVETLKAAGAMDVLAPLITDVDTSIQGLRATLACALLGADWHLFHGVGTLVAQEVSDLLTNIVEKRGKPVIYAFGVFQLKTALKAYRDLARSAARADNENGASLPPEESHTKVLVFPSSIVLLLQLISDAIASAESIVRELGEMVATDLGLPAMDTALEQDLYLAELAAGALEAMLPAVLEPSHPPRQSILSEKAAGDISELLLAYTEIPGITLQAKTSAMNAAAEIVRASDLVRPVLEMAHDLWCKAQKQQRKKHGAAARR